MRLGIDVDGVLANFNAAYIDLCVQVTGKDLFPPRPFDTLTWNYPKTYGYTQDDTTAVWNSIKSNPVFWETLAPYEDTEESLRLLGARSRSTDDVYYVTSRPGINAKRQTETWLRKNGLQDRPTVLICTPKGLMARALDLDAYIDDRWENAQEVAVTKAKSFLLTRSWNIQPDAEVYGITRVGAVKQFLELIA